MRHRVVVGAELASRAAIVAVFAYAAAGKLADPGALAEAVGNYRVLPDAAAVAISVVLPTVELAIAIGLATGVFARGAAVLATALLATFAAAMAQALVRDIDLACGCFGAESSAVTWWTVLRNAGLGAVAAVPLVTGVTAWGDLLRRGPAAPPGAGAAR